MKAAYDARMAKSARAAAALARAPFHATLIGVDGRSVFVGVAFVDGEAVSYAREVDHEALNDRPERVIVAEIAAATAHFTIGPPPF